MVMLKRTGHPISGARDSGLAQQPALQQVMLRGIGQTVVTTRDQGLTTRHLDHQAGLVVREILMIVLQATEQAPLIVLLAALDTNLQGLEEQGEDRI